MICDDVTKQEYLAAVERGAKAAILQALGQPSPEIAPEGPFTPPPAALQAAHAPWPPIAPKPPPAPPPGKLYTVMATSFSGPTASSKQRYLNVNFVAEDCTKAHLRFFWNSVAQDREWKILFAVLLRRLRLSAITDTDQMHGRSVYINMRGKATMAGLESVAAALGFQFGNDDGW